MKRFSLDKKSAAELLPQRSQDSNKGTFGNVMLIAGSYSMVGCCTLLTRGALRSGAGLVTLAFPDCLYTSLTSQLTENIFLPLKTSELGMISDSNIDLLLKCAEKSDVVAFGPGVGVSYSTRKILESLITDSETPLIIDADGLNCLAQDTDLLYDKSCDILITPHPGEMARLNKKSLFAVQSDREKTACEFSEKYNISVLLKGHETVIVNADATEICVNKTGNSGLAKGGSGDLLTGIIAGLSPNMKNDLFSAAALGEYIHGLAADSLRSELSEYSMLPSDICEALPGAFSCLSGKS